MQKHNNEKILTALLMNPSNTFPKVGNNKPKFDQTIRNLIILANAMRYSQIIILNAFATIRGNSKEANAHYKKNSKMDKLNKEFISKICALEDCKDLLVACGDNVKTELYEHYIALLKQNRDTIKFWTYSNKLTAKKRPRHLSLQHKSNRCLFNMFIEKPQKHSFNF